MLKETVSSIWPVHHQSRRGSPHFQTDLSGSWCSNADRHLADAFGFVEYQSPSDLICIDLSEESEQPFVEGSSIEHDGYVQVPRSGPAMTEYNKRRRAALKELRRQKESAWSSWMKPVVKPGDIIGVLKDEGNLGHRILLVHRFWVKEDERSRHILFIPGDTNFKSLPKCGSERSFGSTVLRCMTAHQAITLMYVQ